MKKGIIFLLVCMLMMIPGIANAKTIQPGVPPECECDANDNLCTNCESKAWLFTICDKRSKNCKKIDTDTINNNQKYDLFEIKDREIYLDNSEITLEFNNIWSALEYKIHISGTNKITYLNSINQRKIDEPKVVQEYPALYSNDHIPFTVEGDGTLEIETAKFIKKNELGETYYKCWRRTVTDPCEIGGEPNRKINSTNKINTQDIKLMKQSDEVPVGTLRNCLTEATISGDTVIFDVPSSGYTLSDLKAKAAADRNVFYARDLPSSVSLDEFNDRVVPFINYDNSSSPEERIQYITTLVERGIAINNGSSLECDTQFLVPIEQIYEDAQITASWGSEYIKTELPRRFSKTGSYLINVPEEKEMITTTHKDNITFISKEEFDPSYYLRVDDITEKITEIQSASVQAKTDKVLVELYDINMYDQDDNIVKMENGTYTIKVELNDLLKKYEAYQVIYISDDNKVELIDATVEGNYIVFNTTHLSKYGIVGTEIRKTGNIVTNPQTADKVTTYGLILTSLAVSIALVTLRIRKLKKAD